MEDTVKAFFKTQGTELNAKNVGRAIVIHEILGMAVLGKLIEQRNTLQEYLLFTSGWQVPELNDV